MNKNERDFFVEYFKDDEMVVIHLNDKNIDSLIDHLNYLKSKKDKIDDVHLMIPEWGGSGLASKNVQTGSSLVKQLKIYKWNE